jgi:hypothetical protein
MTFFARPKPGNALSADLVAEESALAKTGASAGSPTPIKLNPPMLNKSRRVKPLHNRFRPPSMCSIAVSRIGLNSDCRCER